jgi:hypothetical protein
MARRPEFPANALTREQLKELKHSLSLLSPHSVRGNYEETLLRGQGVTRFPERRQQLAQKQGGTRRITWLSLV